MTPRRLSVDRLHSASLLLSVFLFAYVFSPYWLAVSSTRASAWLYVVLLAVGIAWTIAASGEIRTPAPRRYWALVALAVAAAALNWRALGQPIPWQGDEDYHIAIAGDLAEAIGELLHRVPPVILIPAITLTLAACVFVWRRHSLWLTVLVFAFVVIALPLAALAVPQLRVPPEILLRYPFLEYWAAAVPPMIASFVVGGEAYFVEPVYRLVPLLSAVLLAWAAYQSVAHVNWRVGILFGIAVITVPLIYYYSSILYLELPAVVLMTCVCLHADDLLGREKSEVVRHPAWYALLVAGFLKETVVPFIAAFLLLRLATRLTAQGRLFWTRKHLLDEITVVFAVAAPVSVYILLCKVLGEMRGYDPGPGNLLDLSVYATLGRSYASQLGPVPLLSIVGLCVLARQRGYAAPVFLLTAFAADATFHILDTKGYLGYSRFNLFLLPPVLAGAAAALAAFAKSRPRWCAVVLAGIVALNLWISPVNPDGSKVPRWDAYRVDTGEHYYPYGETLRWLERSYPDRLIWFTGLRYRYAFDFYFEKLDWHPSFEQRVTDQRSGDDDDAVESVLRAADVQGAEVVVFQPDRKAVPQPTQFHHFRVARVFANDACLLLVYARMPADERDR